MKSKLSALYLLAVFGFGIVSCAPDDTGQNSPHVRSKLPPPVLISSEGHELNFKEKSTAQVHTWSLSDRLVFSDIGNFARLQVKSECLAHGKKHTDLIELNLRPESKILDLVPRSLLTLNLEKSQATCSLDFKAMSARGDIHYFEFDGLKVSNPKSNSISLRSPRDRMLIEGDLTTFTFKEGADITVQFPKGSSLETLLLCDGFTFSSRFDSSSLRSIADYDFRELSENQKVKMDLARRPLRLCRVIAMKENYIEEASPLFMMEFGSAPIEITSHLEPKVVIHAPRNPPPGFVMPVISAVGNRAGGYAHSRFSITNTSGIEQFIRLPRFLPHESVAAIHRGHEISCYRFKSRALPLELSSPLEVVKEDTSSFIIKVPPTGTYSFSYHLELNTDEHPPSGITAPLRTRFTVKHLEIERLQPLESSGDESTFLPIAITAITLPDEVIFSQKNEEETRHFLETCQ